MTQVPGNGPKRAILYARVSTDDQADKGYSLPSQLDETRKYAERLGYEIVGEYREDFTGAVPIAERPEGKKLAAMLKARQADALIAYQVDRLYRDNIELLIAVRQWIRAGIEVHTCDIGKIDDENNIILLVKGWQGHDERAKIRERSMRGKRAKAHAGKVIGCQPALGYRLVRDADGKALAFEIVEQEAGIVRMIFRWYVNGDENGNVLSIRAIAERLSAMKVPTAREFKKGYLSHTKRENGVWNVGVVSDILKNEAYAGTWRYGKRIGETSKWRPLDETIAVSVPAIIDRETWERVQIQRKRNAQFSRRNRKHQYLLSGLILCGKCGFKMSGGKSGTQLYYRCASRVHRFAVIEDVCREFVRADVIEFDVWREIEELFSDLDRLGADLKKAQQEELDTQDPKRAELQAVDGLIEQADQEAREIAAALPKASGRVGETLQRKMEEVNARYEALTKRRVELQAELGALRLTDDAITDIIRFARGAREGIQNADYFTKRRMLESLGVKVTVKDGRYSLECVLGKDEGVISTAKRGGEIVIASTESTIRICRLKPNGR